MKDLKPTLLAEYTSSPNSVKFYSDFTCHCFFDGEIDVVQQNNEFFDFIELVVDCYTSEVRSKFYNVVDNWQELNECFELCESMDDNQKILFGYVLSDYSYVYDLSTLVNYCLENACLFEGKASDYVYELIEDCYDIKNMGKLGNYIDYDAIARDMLLNSEIVELGYNLFWVNPNDIY